ncbi:MAG TPA: ABC transporter permease [Thermotogota bacterium]|nr:ABC transporter permease [Thermotogota bacterium]HPM20902.1 ABC transporter permease [Thermotogota bacterium]
MKSFWGLFAKDVKHLSREQMSRYMLLAPLLLAFVLRMILPESGSTGIQWVVEEELAQKISIELAQFGNINAVENETALLERVRQTSSIFGLVEREGKLTLIRQGNEPEAQYQKARQIYLSLLSQNDSAPHLTIVSFGKERVLIKEIATAMLIMFVTSLSGMLMGFTIVSDKESKAIQALAVSPLSLTEYLLSKALLTLIYGVFFALSAAFIMHGFDFDWANLLLLVPPATLFGCFLGFLLGWIASNQNTAIAAVKFISTILVVLPMLSLILPSKYEPFFYPLPGYWILKFIFSTVTNDPTYWIYFGIATGVGIAGCLVTAPLLKQRLKLRTL